MASKPFLPGERVLLIDDRERRFLLRLGEGEVFHFHGGAVPHDLILGAEEGTVVHSAAGATLRCYRPRLADFVLKMPRGAQVVYPKDLGAILVYADIYTGARVLEAGTGSGALTITLSRATGAQGRVVSYEYRKEFRDRAAANVEMFFGEMPSWVELREGDVRAVGHRGEEFDRVVLDMPEPWKVLDSVRSVLVPGGIVCAFLPTTGQIQSLVLALQESGYEHLETFETMFRPWHVTARSVRPGHRMVGHTGFITTARAGG